jgi:hypothetical protein
MQAQSPAHSIPVLIRKQAITAVPGSVRKNESRLETAAVLAFAFLLFLMVRQATRYIAFPDENFDYMEQAYRLVHGYGTPTWTFELGMRSWIFPGLLAGAMWLGSFFGDAATERMFAHGVIAASALIPVWCAIQWSRWLGAGRVALLAGLLVATWLDVIFWSTVTLSEIFAGNLLCLCVHQAFVFVRTQDRRYLLRLGVALGVVFSIRFHLAPFLFFLAAASCLLDLRRWGLVIAGACAVLVPAGVLDWITLGHPFQSIWLNVLANTKVPISEYGMVKEPIYYLTDVQLSYWKGGAILIGVLALAGLDFFPGLGVLAAGIWLFQSLLSNQQTRFLYPAIVLIVIAAGIGAVRLIQAVQARKGGSAALGVAAILALVWVSSSAYLALAGPYRTNWVHRAGHLALADYVRRNPGICGLAMSAGTAPVFGHSFIGRPIPYYSDLPLARFDALRPYVNAVALSEKYTPPSGFQRVQCWADGYADFFGRKPQDRICLYQRDGGCRAGAPVQPAAWPVSALPLKRFAPKLGGTAAEPQ